jgi:hypothetical protein
MVYILYGCGGCLAFIFFICTCVLLRHYSFRHICPRLCGYDDEVTKIGDEVEMANSSLGQDTLDKDSEYGMPGAMGIYEVGEDNPAIDVAKYDPKADKMKPPRIIKERRSMV